VAIVLDDWVEFWNSEIEPVIEPHEQLDDWSWAVRPIRGQTSGYSNHASATARDINATRHPQGVAISKTFSKTHISRIHSRLGHYTDNAGKRVLRWGGDYVNALTDGMHIEINANATSVAQAAKKIQEEADMQLHDIVTLTAAQAKAMSLNGTPRKAGDKVSVLYLLMWGGANGERDYASDRAIISALANLSGQVSAIAAAVTANGSITQEQLETASRTGASAALADLGQSLANDPAEFGEAEDETATATATAPDTTNPQPLD
jgi:hypothetical protein